MRVISSLKISSSVSRFLFCSTTILFIKNPFTWFKLSSSTSQLVHPAHTFSSMNELGRDPSPAPSGDGSGRSLPPALLISCLIATVFSTVYSLFTINAQLRNYRKPILQRHVVRLLLMVPLYSISSLISLFSLQAAFLIDLMRDLYEAFVIYSFFTLLVEYLGGERSILILLHGRDPINHLFPFNYFLGKIDPSDPYTLLAIKRGVLRELTKKRSEFNFEVMT